MDSGKIKYKKKVSLYLGNKKVGSEIIRMKNSRLVCYTVVKAVKKRKCGRRELENKRDRLKEKYPLYRD